MTNKVWINNKIIFRKVIDIGYFPNSTLKDVAHGLTNVTFTSVTGIGYGTVGSTPYSFNLPFAYASPYQMGLQINGAYVEITTSSSAFTSYYGYAILEYTKN